MTTSVLVIQSKDRILGTPDKFTVRVPPFLNISGVSLLSATIPNTVYNITAANNMVYWNRGGALSAPIPPGAYSITALIAMLGAVMQATDGAAVYTVSYSETTMKLTITSTLAFSLSADNLTNAVWSVLGWGGQTAATPSALSHTAVNVVRLDTPNNLLINLGEWCPSFLASTANIRSCFVVSLDHDSQYVSQHKQLSTFDNGSNYTARNGLATMEVLLTDTDGRRVDLNGAEWVMILRVLMN